MKPAAAKHRHCWELTATGSPRHFVAYCHDRLPSPARLRAQVRRRQGVVDAVIGAECWCARPSVAPAERVAV